MEKFTVATLTVAFACFGVAMDAFASDVEPDQIHNNVEQLSQQNKQLEKRITDLENGVGTTSEQGEKSETLSFINDHVNFSGAIEVEVSWVED
jgi:hypothetical protein